jgi:hypothetical protein
MDTRRAGDSTGTLTDRARRVWRLRRRVLAISLACFVLFFGVMTIRMSLGDDPALGSSAATSSSTGTAEAATQGSEAPSIETRSLFGEDEESVEPEAVHSGQS